MKHLKERLTYGLLGVVLTVSLVGAATAAVKPKPAPAAPAKIQNVIWGEGKSYSRRPVPAPRLVVPKPKPAPKPVLAPVSPRSVAPVIGPVKRTTLSRVVFAD